MKRNILLIILILFNFNLFLFSKNKIYRDENIGFSFKYSNDIILDINNKYNKKELDKKYIIKIGNILFSKYSEDISKIEFIKLLEKGEEELLTFDNSIDNGSLKNYKFSRNIFGQSIYSFGSFVSVGTDYSIILRFIKGDFIVTIWIKYIDYYQNIPKKYPEYFTKLDFDYFWKEPIEDSLLGFYKLILSKSSKAPSEIVKLEKYFKEIVNSLEFFDLESNYFTPTVNNLRFRETPDLNGKYIRSLKKGEKLELLEKGKTETIKGTKGTWVKVETEKGEVGWCFDAYLEEVKKK